jgi:hypothetical protein
MRAQKILLQILNSFIGIWSTLKEVEEDIKETKRLQAKIEKNCNEQNKNFKRTA